jgi:hypothetical protein
MSRWTSGALGQGSRTGTWAVILVCPFGRALALRGEAAATIRLLARAEAGFEELEINEDNAERWVLRMNDQTREMVRAMIDEATAGRAADESQLSIDPAVTQALDTLR